MLRSVQSSARRTSLALELGLLAVTATALRFVFLGYSDFQADEIKALCRVADFSSILEFLRYLLGQRKGPLQFLTTCALSLLDPGFTRELITRLPFALASVAALLAFFLLVRQWFGQRPALYASFLLATNGITVAFGRIVQYQSLVILGGLLALLGLTLSAECRRWRIGGLYLGLLAAAGAVLGHFDAVFFGPPMLVLLVHWWLVWRHEADFPRLKRHLFAAAGLSAALVLVFYLEYATRLGEYQLAYWGDRLASDPTNTLQLFRFYNPGPVVWVYLAAALIGLARVRWLSRWLLTLSWLLPALVFMELLFKDSRTHAYAYLIPLTITAGVGLEETRRWVVRRRGPLAGRVWHAVLILVLLVGGVLSYSLVVDHNPEYPWSSKRTLLWHAEGGFLEGTFGFPYQRDWRALATWFGGLADGEVLVVTNEKPEIASFYLPEQALVHYRTQNLPEWWNPTDGLYVLVVERPQSWLDELWGWKLDEWGENLSPAQVFHGPDGRLLASIYFLTEAQLQSMFP